jgi:hypothetical protein
MRGTSLRLAILFFCTAGSLLILQSAFDASDHRKAERAVRNYAIGDRGLAAIVEGEAPGGEWSTTITHGCRGVVRVEYAAPAGVYAFDYDVPGHMIHPGNSLGERALGRLVAAPPDGGVRRDSGS